MKRHLKEIRTTSIDRCYIDGEILYGNNRIYRIEDILEIEENHSITTPTASLENKNVCNHGDTPNNHRIDKGEESSANKNKRIQGRIL